MTVIRKIVRLSPVLLLGLAVVAVACQQSEASEGPTFRGPGVPTTVAQGAEPSDVGFFGRLLDHGPIDVQLPAGTAVRVRLLQPLSSEASRPGQGFLASVDDAVTFDGRTAILAGALVTGTVRDIVVPPDGPPRLALSFDAVELPSGGSARLDGTVDAAAEPGERVLPAGQPFDFSLRSPTTVELPGERRENEV